MNNRGDNKFDWGETVKVKDAVPSIFHPGAVVSVCGMTNTNSKVLADKYGSHMGEWIYTIEYLGGSDIEIPERYLEKQEEDYSS
jgi:hypothetical protein